MSDCLILYIVHHKACIAGAESTEIPTCDDEWSIYIYISLYSTGPQHLVYIHSYITVKHIHAMVKPRLHNQPSN